jgi:phenylpyruvate tautomerase PptA (4-oxalocrotonate tautomerase family)
MLLTTTVKMRETVVVMINENKMYTYLLGEDDEKNKDG